MAGWTCPDNWTNYWDGKLKAKELDASFLKFTNAEVENYIWFDSGHTNYIKKNQLVFKQDEGIDRNFNITLDLNATGGQIDNGGESLIGLANNTTHEIVYLVNYFGTTFGKRFVSTVATGTQPYICTSTTLNTNLNADLWDGYQFSDYFNQALKTTSAASFANITDSALTASKPVLTDANKKLVSATTTGSGNSVLATSPTLTTPTIYGETAGSTVLTITTAAIPSQLIVQNTVGTTDATPTTLQTLTPATGYITTYEARVNAINNDSTGEGAGYVVRATYSNTAGNNATLIGTVNANYTAESTAAWAATFTTSGGSVLLTVTGEAAHNISWVSTVTVNSVAPLPAP